MPWLVLRSCYYKIIVTVRRIIRYFGTMVDFVDCSAVTDPYRDMQIPVDCSIRANFCCNIRSRNIVQPKLSFRKTGPYYIIITVDRKNLEARLSFR